MPQLIASRFLDHYLVVHPGRGNGMQVGAGRFAQLVDDHAADKEVPVWLSEAGTTLWQLDVAGARLRDVLLLRDVSSLGFARASWEINKGCDYDCEHCYLGRKRFEGLDLEGKQRLLEIMRDAGVLWLQITGGEPLIDRDFPSAYAYANALGMMVTISSNGSRLSNPKIIDQLARQRPYRLFVSVYGATSDSYEGMTRRRGAYRRFIGGLDAAREAELPVELNIVVAKHNRHELAAMKELANRYGFPHHVYTKMSPTLSGGAGPLRAQAAGMLRTRRPFTGCNAGRTFFHTDPFGRASICKVSREQQVDLLAEGMDGLRALGGLADHLLTRTGGCACCALSAMCSTCPPLARLHQQAKAPLDSYCRRGGEPC